MYVSKNTDYIDKVSSLTVAVALSKISTMNFHKMVRDARAQLQPMMDINASKEALAERNEIVDILVVNSDFQPYLLSVSTWETRQYWGYKLSQFLTTKEFLNKEAGLLAGHESHWVEKMAWDAHKIELLDATRLPALLAVWACPASAPMRQNRRVEEGRISGPS